MAASAHGQTAKGGQSQLPTVTLVRATTRLSVRVPVRSDRVCVVGTGRESDVRLDDAGLLDSHANLAWGDAGLQIEPVGTAPVAVNGRAITSPTPLRAGDWVALGDRLFQVTIAGAPPRDPAAASHPAPAAERHQQAALTRVGVSPTPGRIITIGRLADNDIQVSSPVVSRRHARLVESAGRWAIEDLGSTNGTFVNGARVVGQATLTDGERIDIGSFAFAFADGTLRRLEADGGVRVEARDLRKTVQDAATGRPKDLLAGVNLAIRPGEFVGIFGTSGSGKSTLMDALNGRRPASSGSVLYNGTDVYRSFDSFKATIGYVPQQDIVHRKITIRNALAYTARLRLPEDTSFGEIDSYIEHVLRLVGLADKASQPVDTPMPLSGGQFKRVSLAVELVSNPRILFLDEVTSGLDAGTDKKMMRLFADLAADQKTVVCVTHTLENIEACHLVAVLFGGRLVYFGPPADVTGYFRISRPSDVYETLETAPPEVWADRFRQSSVYDTYVVGRLSAALPVAPQPALQGAALPHGSRPRLFDWRQAGILTRRYVDLVLSDRRNLAILLAQAPVIGAVIGLVFGTGESLAARAAAESQISFLLVISAIWFGCLNSAREIVKELPVYLRERSVNLGIGPYVASKVVPLAGLCALQCVMLLAVVSALLTLPGDFAGRVLVLFLTGMAATTMGLTVSALVGTADKAIGMVPILLIPQVILADAIVRLGPVSEVVAKLSMISFWAFDGVKATLTDEVRAATDPVGALLVPVRTGYVVDLAMLAAFFAVFVAITVIVLKLKDRSR